MPAESRYECTCSRCGKSFFNSFLPTRGRVVYCPNCEPPNLKAINLENQLIREEVSIGLEDHEIARRIEYLLRNLSSGDSKQDEGTLNLLLERLLKDQKRRKKILKLIEELQQERGKL